MENAAIQLAAHTAAGQTMAGVRLQVYAGMAGNAVAPHEPYHTDA